MLTSSSHLPFSLFFFNYLNMATQIYKFSSKKKEQKIEQTQKSRSTWSYHKKICFLMHKYVPHPYKFMKENIFTHIPHRRTTCTCNREHVDQRKMPTFWAQTCYKLVEFSRVVDFMHQILLKTTPCRKATKLADLMHTNHRISHMKKEGVTMHLDGHVVVGKVLQ
jgi:hypothetical protein